MHTHRTADASHGKGGRSIRTSSEYRERLSPSLWALVAAAVCAPMAVLTLAPIDRTLALVAGVAVAVAVVVGLVAAAPVVEVRDGMLRAGVARIPVELLGEAEILTGDAAREARGPHLDKRSFVLLRGGIDGLVVIPVLDQNDPAPAWVISTRTPDRLAAAVRRAAARRSAAPQAS
jgi:hypothetical protein